MLEIPLAGRTAPAEESLGDVAYRVIADRLIMLDIRPNEAINETQLSAEMQMGRTPIREALRHLEGDGLAISYPRKGTYAAPVNYADLDEIAQLRQALEPVAAGLAARTVRGEAAETFRQYLDIIRSLGPKPVEQSDLLRLDLAVHQLIYRTAGNRRLEETLLRYANLWTRVLGLALERRAPILDQLEDLGTVVSAILEKNPAAATELMAGHLARLTGFIRGT
ncbi:GntR family transcriptional regulator [Arthrobacter sp. NQ7]|uniref:GntR family transcriptional regulator n=1 Tax=Arthrobacter sp. NQ7 TaxID=3032303 RepID=UPI002410ACAF|nr:GntR family transcriptional regulator [Arthrobacter sp. NQ7]MDJ0459135.1 GntR family transcriptional regulator [Arthrobacter sp. NQ7]